MLSRTWDKKKKLFKTLLLNAGAKRNINSKLLRKRLRGLNLPPPHYVYKPYEYRAFSVFYVAGIWHW